MAEIGEPSKPIQVPAPPHRVPKPIVEPSPTKPMPVEPMKPIEVPVGV